MKCGHGDLFSTNPDLGTILGDTDCDFESFHFVSLFGTPLFQIRFPRFPEIWELGFRNLKSTNNYKMKTLKSTSMTPKMSAGSGLEAKITSRAHFMPFLTCLSIDRKMQTLLKSFLFSLVGPCLLSTLDFVMDWRAARNTCKMWLSNNCQARTEQQFHSTCASIGTYFIATIDPKPGE